MVVGLAKFLGIWANVLFLGTKVGFNNYVIESVADEDKIPAWEVIPQVIADIKIRMRTDLVYLNMTKGGKIFCFPS
ncbi:hypothetical protein M1146_04080 [Patescibacteria group bacterium]|nr:hypothetical protein [Patescibacteria group bacterium]